MYDFWYNKLIKDSPCAFDLGMSDTDSLLFKVDKPDVFWAQIDQHMDYSNYDPSHPKYTDANKAKLGFFKNEFGSEKKCLRFIGLRAKCYSLKTEDKNKKISSKCVAKGVGRKAIENRMNFDQYAQSLEDKKVIRHSFASIRSTKHSVFTVMQSKKALTHFDSKRWIFQCGIHSVSYGHYHAKIYLKTCPFCKTL